MARSKSARRRLREVTHLVSTIHQVASRSSTFEASLVYATVECLSGLALEYLHELRRPRAARPPTPEQERPA